MACLDCAKRPLTTLSDSLKRDSRGATISVEAQLNSFKNSPGRAVLLLTLQRSKASEEHFESDREQCAPAVPGAVPFREGDAVCLPWGLKEATPGVRPA